MMDVLVGTVKGFIRDDCPRKAAALAFYAIFALPPLLLLLIMIAGVIWGEQAARGELVHQMEAYVGPEAAQQINTMIDNANDPKSQTGLVLLGSIAALLFSATGALGQIQRTLNEAWNVTSQNGGGIRGFLLKRLVSLLYILGLGALLVAAVVVSGALAALQDDIETWINVPGIKYVFFALNFVLTIAILTVLFAAVYKFFPDIDIEWKDVWLGAVVTAVLFVLGKFLIGFYLGYSDKTGAYGAAGSMALLLLWIYYSAMIFLLGAEFTQNWWEAHGQKADESGDDRVVERGRERPTRYAHP